MYNPFIHRNILVRGSVLWIIGFVCMFIAWSISYRSLPEGILHGKVLISYIEIVKPDFFPTFIRILTYNLFLASLPLIITNFFKIRWLPLGYLLVPYHWIVYGILLGTNSFAVPSPTRLLPSLDILYYGVGMYEITAYTWMVASTYNLSTLLIDKVDRKTRVFTIGEMIALILSILLLISSNFIEAQQLTR
jgi:hypothetical protein